MVRTDFCELLRNPSKYNGDEVTVRATHQYGFEWSTLYCLTCLDKGKAWLEIGDELDDASKNALRHAPKGAGIVNLTVTGTFRAGGTYGHLNGYRYQFDARKVWDVVVLENGMQNPDKEKAIQKKWACGGENPK